MAVRKGIVSVSAPRCQKLRSFNSCLVSNLYTFSIDLRQDSRWIVSKMCAGTFIIIILSGAHTLI